jgi:predicted flap endonuclease-1-like 5' DNA nuclease
MESYLFCIALLISAAFVGEVGLLLVAAITGFIIAWFYYKYIYAKKIIAIESEKFELNKNNGSINAEKNNLIKSIWEKDNQIHALIQEVTCLKSVQNEVVYDTPNHVFRNKSRKHPLNEKNNALMHIAEQSHLLDYNSFGIATLLDKDDLRMISGIGSYIEECFHALNIFTFHQISKFTENDIRILNDAIEYFSGRIVRDEWVVQAIELVNNKEKRAAILYNIGNQKPQIQYNRIGVASKFEADDLTNICGIGGWIQQKLNALDIYTFRQISNFNNDDVNSITLAIGFFPGRMERDEWILQASNFYENSKKETNRFDHITNHNNLSHPDRLEITPKHLANNLTLISGISLWIEERLNMLDIYTFKQISNITAIDADGITELLGLSPGRIEREHWVSQAHEFAEINSMSTLQL